MSDYPVLPHADVRHFVSRAAGGQTDYPISSVGLLEARLTILNILYRVLRLRPNPVYYTWTPSSTKRNSGCTEFLQLCPVVAFDDLLNIDRAVISPILSLDEHSSQTSLNNCGQIFYYQAAYCSYVVLPSQQTHWQMLHKQPQSISMLETEHMFCL
jgi:hypothetical protein